jgi:alkaline phosphatase D
MNKFLHRFIFVYILFGFGFITYPKTELMVEFQSEWPNNIKRIWIGPEYWSNRLQDWRIRDGRLECLVSAENRNVHILTHQIGGQKGDFNTNVRFGLLNENYTESDKNWIGFRIGAKGNFDDYRDNAIYGIGLDAGITTSGRLFIGENKSEETAKIDSTIKSLMKKEIELCLTIEPSGEKYIIELSVFNPEENELVSSIKIDTISGKKLIGNIALVSNFTDRENEIDIPSVWFSSWSLSGSKLELNEEQTYGPILFSQYTLSNGILKMTAQLPPISKEDGQTVKLQIQKNNGDWRMLDESRVDTLSRTATFRIDNFDASQDTPYRLVHKIISKGNKLKEHYWKGIIRKEPMDKDEIVLAGFTGNNDLGFPNNDMILHLKYHDPDILFFSGDQIYERVGGYGFQSEPVNMATLDYLRKWYLFGWVYRDLMRDRPSITIPDDHDVYHGNLWGCGGVASKKEGTQTDQNDSGGYTMPPEWVNMVQRTQTSHLPDPYDSTPVEQGIKVYYCEFKYAGISFAIIEDRKFKSAPKPLLPEAKIWNGWPQNKDFDVLKKSDIKGAVLLGDIQLEFLRNWASDWSNNTWMKVVLSQTIFANVATLPEKALSDEVVPELRIFHPDEYPENDKPVTDMDSNGWPQTPRNKALKLIRKAFALHIAGDQHLGSTIQYGVDDWHDAGYAFCVPAVSNIWPRRWYPYMPGKNRAPGSPKYTGDFKDGFGNFMTVYAVSNPVYTGMEPSLLYDRATGYGIVRFNRKTRDILIECWPRWVDPKKENAKQYPGWPIKINQLDNYGRKSTHYLPTIKVSGIINPIVQVTDYESGEIIYTLRINGTSFRPRVFKEGKYNIKIGEVDLEKIKIVENVPSIPFNIDTIINVTF